MEKKYIAAQIFEFNDEDFAGSLEDTIKTLQRYNEKYIAEGWRRINIEKDHYNDYVEFCMYGERLENDQEYKNRIEAEQKAAERQKKLEEKIAIDELKEYKRLKKKFEKK